MGTAIWNGPDPGSAAKRRPEATHKSRALPRSKKNRTDMKTLVFALHQVPDPRRSLSFVSVQLEDGRAPGSLNTNDNVHLRTLDSVNRTHLRSRLVGL